MRGSTTLAGFARIQDGSMLRFVGAAPHSLLDFLPVKPAGAPSSAVLKAGRTPCANAARSIRSAWRPRSRGLAAGTRRGGDRDAHQEKRHRLHGGGRRQPGGRRCDRAGAAGQTRSRRRLDRRHRRPAAGRLRHAAAHHHACADARDRRGPLNLLLDDLGGSAMPPRRVELGCHLIERQSTAPPRRERASRKRRDR
jgi:hypothetical protein